MASASVSSMKKSSQPEVNGLSEIFSFKKHNNGWENGEMDNRFHALILPRLKTNGIYVPYILRLPNQALIDIYSTLEHVFGPRQNLKEQIKQYFINQHVWTLDEMDNFVYPIIEKYYITAEEIADEGYASKCAFFRECVDAIANSTVQPSVENYHTFIDDNPHNHFFDDKVAEHVVRNSSMNGTVNNLLRSLKDALLKMVEGPFSFKHLKEKMLDDTALWTWNLKRVLKFKEEPTKGTFTSMVMNEAKEAHDKMLCLFLIVKVSLLTEPWSSFESRYAEKSISSSLLKYFYVDNFNTDEEEAALNDDNYHHFALLSASFMCFSGGSSFNESLNVFFCTSSPANREKGEKPLSWLYNNLELAKYAVDEAFGQLIIYSKDSLGYAITS